VRREPRREALSTLEAAALLLKYLGGGAEIEAALLDRLDRLIGEARTDSPAQARKAARSNL
jgi:DTW domain-containing protein YfiP